MLSGFNRWIVVLVGSALALVAVALYFRDIENESLEDARGEPLGVVVESREDVSRRPAHRMLWNALPNRRFVYPRDTIRTGAGSSVKIDLHQRGFLELRGDSLVVLDLTADQVRVNLASGELFAKGPLLARVGDTEVQAASGGGVQIRQDTTTGRTEVQSRGGKARVRTKDTEREVSAGATLSQDATAKVEVARLPFVRLAPFDDETLTVEKGSPVLLSFDRDPAEAQAPSPLPEQIFIELSAERTFRKSVRLPVPNPAQPVVQTTLTEGHYFWRVAGLPARAARGVSAKPLSNVGAFTVRHPLRIVWLPDSLDTLQITEQGLVTHLAWSPLGPAASFRLRVIDATQATTPELPVAPLLEQSLALATRLDWKPDRGPLWEHLQQVATSALPRLAFTIEALDREGKVLAATPRRELQLSDTRQAAAPRQVLAAAEKADVRRARISWQADHADHGFELELGDRTLPLQTFQHEVPTADLYALVTAAKPLRIRTLAGPSGRPSEWVPVEVDRESLAIVELARLAPAPRYPLEDSTLIARTNPMVKFFWKSRTNSRYQPLRYEIEITGPEDFKPLRQELGEANFQIKVPKVGSYAWKIRAQWTDFGWGPVSALQHFRVSGGAALQAPLMRRPANADVRTEDADD
jgi:hypothetical protein